MDVHLLGQILVLLGAALLARAAYVEREYLKTLVAPAQNPYEASDDGDRDREDEEAESCAWCGERSKAFSLEAVSLRHAWEFAKVLVYKHFRPPFAVQDRVMLLEDIVDPAGTCMLPKNMRGEVLQLHNGADGQRVSVEFSPPEPRSGTRTWGRPSTHAPWQKFEGDDLLKIETKEQAAFKEKTGRYLLLAGIGLLVVLILAIGPWTHSGGGGRGGPTAPVPVSAGPGPAVAAIPAAGCCSWMEGVCGRTTSACADEASCVSRCYGKWLRPG